MPRSPRVSIDRDLSSHGPPNPALASAVTALLAHLEAIAASDFQGKGIGGRMLDQLIETARATGIEQLTLDARGDNRAAHALWRSRGFVEYGRIADFVAVGGTRYDKTFWVLDLRAG